MPKKKKYISYMCKECEIDFISRPITNPCCPLCGDNICTESKGTIWLERPFQYKRPWTKEDDELLILGDQHGYSRQDIADELDRTRKAVNRRAQQLGITKRRGPGALSSMQQ